MSREIKMCIIHNSTKLKNRCKKIYGTSIAQILAIGLPTVALRARKSDNFCCCNSWKRCKHIKRAMQKKNHEPQW